MNKLMCCLVIPLMCVLIMTIPASAQTTQVDALIEKLVEKGILTRNEGIKLKGEIAADEKIVREESMKMSLPEWVQKMKLKGDLRLRHQYERTRADTEGRNRGRIRYRLGVETNVTDNVKVGAALASGGSDPRSTNQTLENTFETPDIRLDLAYAEYAPLAGLKFVGGKFGRKDYLWTPTDMLWDGDINPNGGSVNLEHSLTQAMKGFLNSGVWIIDSNDQVDRPDPFLTYVQGGLKGKYDKFDATAALIYYNFHGVKGLALNNDSNTNTQQDGVLKFDYDAFGGSLEAGAAKLFGGLPLDIDERIAVFYDYIASFDAPDNETGWAAGIKFGNKKIENKGQWQMKYQYVNLGKDAFIDAFPDSDRYGGATDAEGHEAIVGYGLSKNVTLGIDYYYARRIKAAANPEHLVQADLNLKF